MKNSLPKEWLTFETAEQWREWLQENHASKQEIWLRIKRARAPVRGILNQEAVLEALCFGWIDSHMRPLDAEGYVLRFTTRRKGSSWSRVNRERAERLIAEGRMTEAGLKEIQRAKANGKWEAVAKAEEEK